MKNLCSLCPRNCQIDRLSGQVGFCGQTNEIKVARAALHMWEEPCISGTSGSGTVFFSGCTLRCVYCQNAAISSGSHGKLISIERLSDIFLELQAQGANNINLVTPSHFVPQIVKALELSKTSGLTLPIIYNTGSYETLETLRMLDGLVDIYLPDLKYYSSELSLRYSRAKDYFDVATRAIAEMVRQTGSPVFAAHSNSIADIDSSDDYAAMPLISRGVIVRHLVLPGYVEDSKKVINYLYNTYGNHIYISIMNQFTPTGDLSKYPELNRKLTSAEYDDVIDYAISLGVENGFIQEGDTADESFIPPFDLTGV